LRTIWGAILGPIVWLALATALNLVLRYTWHDYAMVEKAMTFTVPMMAARLTVSGIGSLVGGVAAAAVGRNRVASPLLAGLILLAIFAPFHLTIWPKFPIWYHLTFLISLPVLSLLGGRLARSQSA